MSMPAANTLWIATRKGLFSATRSAAGWRLDEAVHFLGEPVSMVLPDERDGSLHAALRLGHFGCKLHCSVDRGATWQEQAAPAYPPKPADAEVAPGVLDTTPWTLDTVWSLEAAGADQPGRLWAGTIPGGLFRSDDAGASWQLVEGLWQRPERQHWMGGGYDQPGLHSVDVDPRDSRRLVVAVSTGGVWRSEDDGATWLLLGHGLRNDYMPPERAYDPLVQDVHRLARCAAQPDVMWIQHHNGIFRSTDGGVRWQALTGVQPSDFGFAVVAHPTDPGTAWFVPAVRDAQRIPVNARLVVTRTRDGGKSFEALGAGLPSPAWDLVYRHGLAIDPSGTTLAMGSTTGGLWLSDDGGDQWQILSAHLPPVYAVRFG
jgi:hypothetical protein